MLRNLIIKICILLQLPVDHRPQDRESLAIVTWFLVFTIVFFNLLLGLLPHATIVSVFDHFGLSASKWSNYWGLTFLTSEILHSGPRHWLANCYGLLAFGPAVEKRIGHFRFFIFFLATALISGSCWVVFFSDSPLSTIGISDFCAALIGFYFVCFPRKKLFVWMSFYPVSVSWLAFAALYLVSQLLGLRHQVYENITINYAAHLSGMATGILAGFTVLYNSRTAQPVETDNKLQSQTASRARFAVQLLLLAVVLLGYCTSLLATFAGLVSLLAVMVPISLIAIVSAVRFLYRDLTTSLSLYDRWYVSLTYPLLIIFSLVLDKPYEAFKIPSSSMEPTIIVGDLVMTEKRQPGQSLFKRGDIVVFESSEQPLEQPVKVIKRIVGLPGETVEVAGSTVKINGVPIDENYAFYRLGGKKDFSPQTIPSGSYFLLGDNRDFSKDSRYYSIPFISAEQILGTVKYVYWSSVWGTKRMGYRPE